MNSGCRLSTVGCVQLKLSFSSFHEGNTVLSCASSLFYRVIWDELDHALTGAPSLQVDRIMIRLGVFANSDWEIGLRSRLRLQLEQLVRAWHLESEAELKAGSDLVVASLVQANLTPLREFAVPLTAEIESTPHPEKLAQASLQPGKLTFWLKRLNMTTLTSIIIMLADEIPYKLLTRKQMAEILPLIALVYLQRHPQIPVPAPPATAQLFSVTTLRNWLPRLLAYPLRAEVRQWLYVLCSTAEAKTCLADALATITLAQARTPLSPVRSDPLELPPASAQPLPFNPLSLSAQRLPFSPLPLNAQPAPRPKPPIRINSGITWPIHEAGLGLLWPLLPSLFKKMGLIVDQQWVQPESHYRALRCLQGLVWGEGPLMWGEDWPDSALLRWLCGMAIGLPLAAPDGFEDNPDDLTELDAWLTKPPTAPLDNWSDFSLAELRERFLQRPGKLSLQGGQWSLEIELEPGTKAPPPVPWPVSVLSYPWLSQPLFISFYEAPSGDENM